MPDAADRPATPARVLILAPNWLGDAVMALPAVADIRHAFPSARVIVAARRAVADLFRLAPSVDEVVTLQWNGRWPQAGAFASDVRRLRGLRLDRAMLLPNSFAAALLVRCAGVPERAGYARDMRAALLTRAVPRPAGSRHQGAYYQHLTASLGMSSGPLEPRLSVPPGAVAAARSQLREAGWDGTRPLVAFAPGAAYGTAKQWLPEHVARVVANLVMRRHATCVLVGSAGDAPTTRAIAAMLDSAVAPHVLDLAGETTIETLAGVLTLARAALANDSGAMHLAAAVGTPLVAIFGPTREQETSPLAHAGRSAVVLTHDVSCRPCMLRECPIDHRCMTGIPPERVYASLESLLSSTTPGS